MFYKWNNSYLSLESWLETLEWIWIVFPWCMNHFQVEAGWVFENPRWKKKDMLLNFIPYICSKPRDTFVLSQHGQQTQQLYFCFGLLLYSTGNSSPFLEDLGSDLRKQSIYHQPTSGGTMGKFLETQKEVAAVPCYDQTNLMPRRRCNSCHLFKVFQYSQQSTLSIHFI